MADTKKSHDSAQKVDVKVTTSDGTGKQAGAAKAASSAKDSVMAARQAMKDAAAAMHDLAHEMSEEVRAGTKGVRERAIDAASEAADRASKTTGGASTRINDAAVKAVDAAGDAMDKAYDVASDAADKAFNAASKVADSSAEVAGDAAEKLKDASGEFMDKTADAASKAVDAATQTGGELLEQAKKDAADWQDKFLRLHAEWDTYRRRTNEQRELEKDRATENLVGSLLPVIDDFERTIDYANENGEENLLGGVQAVYAKLIDVLEKDGVEMLDPKDEAFDPLEGQAVGTVDDASIPDETVVEVYQKGCKMAGKVIRPAMVTVSTGGPKRETEDDETE